MYTVFVDGIRKQITLYKGDDLEEAIRIYREADENLEEMVYLFKENDIYFCNMD